NFAAKLYLFDGSYGKSRTIQLRQRNKQCDVCGDNPTITELIDYAAFCGSGACDKSNAMEWFLKSYLQVAESYHFAQRMISGHRSISIRFIVTCEDSRHIECCNLREAFRIDESAGDSFLDKYNLSG
ncbi:hypothetical protein COOONC_07027, partial [Cooperia oncophora]